MNLTQAMSKILILIDELDHNGMIGKYAKKRLTDEIVEIQTQYNKEKRIETMM